MITPKNALSINTVAVITISRAEEDQMKTDISHYSPTDFDGDYHVEQDDETDD